MRSSAKYFHDLIFFAAAGVVKMLTCWFFGSVQSVSRWQWSGLSCEMIIRSSFCLRSASEEMCGFSVCFVKWKVGCRTELWPASHGSIRMLKVPAQWSGWSDVVKSGEKANRNVQSELSCCMDRDMMIVYVRVRAVSSGYHLVLVELMDLSKKKRSKEGSRREESVKSCRKGRDY